MFKIGDKVVLVGFRDSIGIRFNGIEGEVISDKSNIGSYTVRPLSAPYVGGPDLGVLEENLKELHVHTRQMEGDLG